MSKIQSDVHSNTSRSLDLPIGQNIHHINHRDYLATVSKLQSVLTCLHMMATCHNYVHIYAIAKKVSARLQLALSGALHQYMHTGTFEVPQIHIQMSSGI